MTKDPLDHFEWSVTNDRGYRMQLVWTKASVGAGCAGPYCHHVPTSRGVGVEELLEGDGPHWWETQQWMRTGCDPAVMP